MDTAKVEQTSPSSITISSRERPSFMAMTAGKAMVGGLVGAAAMVIAGNNLVEENEIEDPAGQISSGLAASLAERLGIAQVDENGFVTKETAVAGLSKDYAASDLLVDVETLGWGFTYYPFAMRTYDVTYSARLKVIDTRSMQAVAEAHCNRWPERNDDSPSHAELLANGAERLKQDLSAAADSCLREFENKIFPRNQQMLSEA
ncbi:hypothetical protein HNO53_01035 [Billgrantia antri]|uniref:Lipoprotein n=1 Tax=Halomonas sulfidivorans TaxID=2733488 RepID=A0ABX7WAN1_9GAMM|nr:hypothetical protein [Halomonas sulfidivorans]QTP57429.1 hypothetical protein HNO53_01035 [Halomonas sulfidivorans]